VPVASLVGALIAFEMILVLVRGFNVPEAKPLTVMGAPVGAGVPNTKLLGMEMYSTYLFPLEVAAVILLVAIVAAIALTLRRRKDSRYLNPSVQVRAKKADRLRIVKMDPVREQPSVAADAADTATKGQQA
jgi:NADH-quinone oxidoreductase subunit J